MGYKTLKPIETRYKGIKFRSKLEARWAVYFDEIGADWEYEPEGFDLGSGIWYLPDFLLHNVTGRAVPKNGDLYVEVKGVLTPQDEIKIERFLKDTKISEWESHPERPLFVVGSIPWGETFSEISDDIVNLSSKLGWCFYTFETLDGDNWPAFLGVTTQGQVTTMDLENYHENIDYDKIEEALDRARNYRFDHRYSSNNSKPYRPYKVNPNSFTAHMNREKSYFDFLNNGNDTYCSKDDEETLEQKVLKVIQEFEVEDEKH